MAALPKGAAAAEDQVLELFSLRGPVLATLGEVENFLLSFFDHLPQTRALFDPLMDGLPGDPHASGFLQGLRGTGLVAALRSQGGFDLDVS